MTPDDRKYTTTHEWIKIEGDIALVGITDHAQAALGDITYVAAGNTGKSVAKAGECGVIESVKAASDIYAPVAGEIAGANDELKQTPEIVNQDPYGKGWILKLRKIDASQLSSLMSSTDYDAFAEKSE